VRSTGINEDYIGCAKIVCYPIAMRHLSLWKVSKILTRLRGEAGIHLDGHDLAARPDNFSYDCSVITDTTTYMENAVTFSKFKIIDKRGNGARLSMVQIPSQNFPDQG
jgi:hypothetical protein